MKDDIMKEVAASRPDHLRGDGTADEATRRSDLSRAFSQPRVTARRRRRLVIFPAVVAGVAAATALALVVGLDGGGTRRPSPATTVPLGPDSVFLAAAAAAAMERQPTGEYWFTDQIQGQSYIVKDGYAVTGAHSETFEWTAVKKGGGNLFYGRDLPARPLTKEDEAAWRKAGKPSSFRVWSNDHYGTYTTKSGPWQADRPQARAGGKFFIPGGAGEMTAAQLQNMTTDPAKLAKLFFAPKRSQNSVLSEWSNDPAHVVLTASEAFGNAPLPPKVRAGLMRAFVAQPGVRNLGTVTDPLGRRGIAIGADWADQEPALGRKNKVTTEPAPFGAREELIFDAKTGEYLGDQKILTRPGGIYRTRKPGFVINYWLERGSGWTDKKPVPPRKLPFSTS